MECTQSIGPAADQNNIPAAWTTVNNISIVATKAGHGLLVARVQWMNVSSAAQHHIAIQRNAVTLTGSISSLCMPHAGANVATGMWTAVTLTNMAIGDVFTIVAYGDGAADLPSNQSILMLVTG